MSVGTDGAIPVLALNFSVGTHNGGSGKMPFTLLSISQLKQAFSLLGVTCSACDKQLCWHYHKVLLKRLGFEELPFKLMLPALISPPALLLCEVIPP